MDRAWLSSPGLRTLAAAFAALCACIPAGGTAIAANPVLTFSYVACNSLRLNPTVVAAGTYGVLVNDDDNCKANFSISGPGVSFVSDLDSTGMGIDHPAGPFGPFTFQAGSAYLVRDSLNPGVTLTFTPTASSASSAASAGGSSSSGATSSVSAPAGGSTTAGKSATGSASTAGTLAASISASGRTALRFAGKAVTTVRPGLYRLTVVDGSVKGTFLIEKVSFPAMTYPGSAATGTSSHTVRLTAGRYFYAASTGGPKTYFTVAA